MKQDNAGFFKQTFSLDSRTGRVLVEEAGPVRRPATARRFSCVFLSTSAKDAASLNQRLSAAGIRVYLARDAREAELLLAITGAKILLIDIDRTIEPWPEILQTFDESHPGVPKIVLTGHSENAGQRMLPQFALDVVPKPACLGDLLGSLESAHSLEQALNDPQRARERIERVLARIHSTREEPEPEHIRPNVERVDVSSPVSLWHAFRVRLSGMMNKAAHVWWNVVRHQTRDRRSHA